MPRPDRPMTDEEKTAWQAMEACHKGIRKRGEREAPLKGGLELVDDVIAKLIEDLHKRIEELEERVKKLEDK
jgi:hypothetical protein